MLPRNSESSLRSLMYYYNSQRKLIINDSKFTKDMRVDKDEIQTQYPNVQIEIKNSISILSNGSENDYCTILSRVLHCNPITQNLFLHNMKNRPKRIDNDFVSQVNNQHFHGPASQPYSRNRHNFKETTDFLNFQNNNPQDMNFSNHVPFPINPQLSTPPSTDDIPHSLPYKRIENNNLGIRVEKPKSLKLSNDYKQLDIETHLRDSNRPSKIQFTKSPPNSTPNSHNSMFDTEKYSEVQLETSLSNTNGIIGTFSQPPMIHDITLPPAPDLSTVYDLPPPPPLDTLDSSPNLMGNNDNNSISFGLKRLDFDSDDNDDDEIKILINDHHPHFDANIFQLKQDSSSDDEVEFIEMPKFNPTTIYFSNNIQRHDHVDSSYIKEKIIQNSSEVAPLTLKMLSGKKSIQEKIEIKKKYPLLKSLELELLPIQNETIEEIPESIHSHIPKNSMKAGQVPPVLDFYPKQIHSCPGTFKNIVFLPNNSMKLILNKQNFLAVNRILGINPSIHYNSIIFQETEG